jgi:endonuclease G
MFKIFKKIGVVLLLLVHSPLLSANAQQPSPRPLIACNEFLPYGFPVSTSRDATTICRSAYLVQHDNIAKIPRWVAYSINKEQAIGCASRVNSFSPDQSLKKGQRSETADYANSGFDMGHMASHADMSWDQTVSRESFILTNIAPQAPGLNRGVWKTLETITRYWALNSETGITVYTGPIFNVDTDKKIGINSVVVPSHFYKIIIHNDKKKTVSFKFPNTNQVSNNLANYLISIAQLEKETKIKFPVPGRKDDIWVIWSYDLRSLTTAKKQECTP